MNWLKKLINKNILFAIAFISGGLLINSCTDSSDTDLIGNWTKSSDFEGVARNEAVSFVIDNIAYVGTGYNGKKELTDFWKYDCDKKTWSQIASLPLTAVARYSAVAFSINGKGYVGCGYDGDNYLKDFYEYDPSSDTWTEIESFKGSARYGAVGFAVGNKGYVSSGYDDNYLKDLWEYDPNGNVGEKWKQKSSLPGTKRKYASAFVIGDKAYVCAGQNNGSLVSDFYSYDQSTDTWTTLREITKTNDNENYDDEYTSIVRSNAVSFVSAGKAYLALGTSGSLTKTVWEYDPTVDKWEEKTGFEGTVRDGAVGFSVKDRLFVTTGRSSGYQLDDTWEFKPSETYDDKN